jgi:hypothetical protein
MPVITCSGKRSAKVAPEITDKGYCSTKGMYYHGLKLHALGFRRKGHLPHPEYLLFSKASVNDLTSLKDIFKKISGDAFRYFNLFPVVPHTGSETNPVQHPPRLLCFPTYRIRIK